MKSWVKLAILLLFFGVGTIFADTINDPIIDIEPGTGTIRFTGSLTFTVDTTQGGCSGDGAIVTCGNRDANGNLVFFHTDGSHSGARPVLGNATGKQIFNLDFVFSTAQDGFHPGTQQDSDLPHTPLFTSVTQVSPFEAIYSGSLLNSNCTGEGELFSCSPDSEFTAGFAEFFAPAGGIETITIRSNVAPVPEPGSIALVLSGAGVLLTQRKRLLRRN